MNYFPLQFGHINKDLPNSALNLITKNPSKQSSKSHISKFHNNKESPIGLRKIQNEQLKESVSTTYSDRNYSKTIYPNDLNGYDRNGIHKTNCAWNSPINTKLLSIRSELSSEPNSNRSEIQREIGHFEIKEQKESSDELFYYNDAEFQAQISSQSDGRNECQISQNEDESRKNEDIPLRQPYDPPEQMLMRIRPKRDPKLRFVRRKNKTDSATKMPLELKI